MSILKPTIGPFAAVYIGDASSGSVLVPIQTTRTQGATLNESVPGQFLDVAGCEVQADRHKVEITLNFLGDDPLVTKVARGMSTTASAEDGTPDFTKYTLLCVFPDEDANHSYLFPSVYTHRTFNQTYSKSQASVLSITFACENRDRTTALFYKGNLAYIITKIAGGRSPF